jgi:anti-sigma factor RsiW
MNERQVGGLWCREVLEHLDAFVDGELPGPTLASVQAHVAECTQCAQFGAAYARLVGALRASPDAALDEARMQRLKRHLAEVE